MDYIESKQDVSERAKGWFKNIISNKQEKEQARMEQEEKLKNMKGSPEIEAEE